MTKQNLVAGIKKLICWAEDKEANVRNEYERLMEVLVDENGTPSAKEFDDINRQFDDIYTKIDEQLADDILALVEHYLNDFCDVYLVDEFDEE